MKKLFSYILIILLILISPVYANQPVYDMGDGYTAVRNDIFDELVKNDKLVELLGEEVEYYKDTLNQLIEMSDKKSEIQDARIFVLKDTLVLKDQIIDLKEINANNYEKLYIDKSDEVKSLKRKNLFEKILITGLGAYAVSEIDDNTGKTIVGGLTLFIVLN